MVSNFFARLGLGAMLLTSMASAQDSSVSSSSPTQSSGQPGAGASGSGGGGPQPSPPVVPDSSKPDQYKPNINMTYWQPAGQDATFALYPDVWFFNNATLFQEVHEWNVTYSHTPLNLSSGEQTAVGSPRAVFRANPYRRPWAQNGTDMATVRDAGFWRACAFFFSGTRAVLHGNLTGANWHNSSQPPMIGYWTNTKAVVRDPNSPTGVTPLRLQNITEPFPDGIAYDTGELAYGSHYIDIWLYSGTLELDGLEVYTGFKSEYDDLSQVPKTTVHTVENGTVNPFYSIPEGSSTIRNDILGDGSPSGGTVQWDSVDSNNGAPITFKTLPNATYMIINGTIGPEYSQLSLGIAPMPPASMLTNAGSTGALGYSPYRNPAVLFWSPLDPKVQYTISILGGLTTQPGPPQTGMTVTPWTANVHSVTFWLDKVAALANGTSTGESRASRNAKIIGGAVGGGLGLLLILGLLAFCCMRKRKPSAVTSDPTPFEVDGTGSDRATRVPSDDDESADKVADELSSAQVAKAREAGFLGESGNAPRRWTYRQPPASEAGVSVVPSSVLEPGTVRGPGSVAASSSLEPSDDTVGAGPSSGDRRIQQAEDGGAVDDDGNVVMVPPSYNPSWASRGANLADSGAVTRVVSDHGATAVAEVDEEEPPALGRAV